MFYLHRFTGSICFIYKGLRLMYSLFTNVFLQYIRYSQRFVVIKFSIRKTLQLIYRVCFIRKGLRVIYSVFTKVYLQYILIHKGFLVIYSVFTKVYG